MGFWVVERYGKPIGFHAIASNFLFSKIIEMVFEPRYALTTTKKYLEAIIIIFMYISHN